MTENQLRKHIHKIRALRLLIILLLIISAISLTSSWFLTESYYSKWINSTEGSTSQKLENIERAIALKPENTEGYSKILAVYLEDDTLSMEEYTKFNLLITSNQKKLHEKMDDTASLYRQIAFTYLTSYDVGPQNRLKAAYPYIKMAQQSEDTNTLVQTTISVYEKLCEYFSEYVWLTNTGKEPSASEISDLLWRVSATMDVLNQSNEEERLAFACCVAALLTEHGEIWEQKTGSTAVQALADEILQQTTVPASTPTAIRLQEELKKWQFRYYTENREDI